MKAQNRLGFTLRRLAGESTNAHKTRENHFNSESRTVSANKLFADLLKRQARRIMADVTECPPDTIPAHLARVNDLLEIVGHLIRHDYAATAEGRLSGLQLSQPSTLADFAECLKITKQQHRSPAWINSRDAEIAEINHKLDVLTGLVANNQQLVELLESQYQPELLTEKGGAL